jgi:DNA segregation ATPase FtsK/SpoIIIE-like protein
LAVKEVRVERHRNRADLARVSIIRRDPLGECGPLVWPNLQAARLSVWQPIPVGIDEMGDTVTVGLPERNVLIGGEPGAGKSVALSMLVATAALDPRCELFLLDGKRLELAYWRGCAKAAAAEEFSDAIGVLTSIRDGIKRRLDQLEEERRRKVIPEDDMPLQVVVCDELAYYLTMGNRDEKREFEFLARDIVSRGRSVGIIFLAATQKPSHDIIPTSLRDLFAFRWALRCTTPQASDTILGAGWASRDYCADRIDSEHHGVGYLLAEGGLPRRIKSFYLADADLEALAARAEALRKEVKPLRSVA